MKATLTNTFLNTLATAVTVGTVDCMIDGDWTLTRGFHS